MDASCADGRYEPFHTVDIYTCRDFWSSVAQIDGSSISLGNNLYACDIASVTVVDNRDTKFRNLARYESLSCGSSTWLGSYDAGSLSSTSMRSPYTSIKRDPPRFPSARMSGRRICPSERNFLPKRLDQIPDPFPILQCSRKVGGICQVIQGTPSAAFWVLPDFEEEPPFPAGLKPGGPEALAVKQRSKFW